MYYAYILKSLKNGQYYYGSTNNLGRRVDEHNSGQVKATRYKRPFEIVYFEEFKTLKESRTREMYFKKMKNRKYIDWIIKNNKGG